MARRNEFPYIGKFIEIAIIPEQLPIEVNCSVGGPRVGRPTVSASNYNLYLYYLYHTLNPGYLQDKYAVLTNWGGTLYNLFTLYGAFAL